MNLRPSGRGYVSTRREKLRFESLESRLLLSADFSKLSQLTVNPDSYSTESIIIRLADGGENSQALLPVAGTQLRAAYKMLPQFRTVDLGPGISVEDAIAYYSADPLVAYAEPDYRIQLTLEPDDSDYTDLWGMNNIGQTGGVVDIDIDAPEAWEVTQGNSETIVAVIDTGVDYRHPDLANNIWVNTAEQNGLPGVDDDGNGYVDDIHGYDFFNNDGDPLDDHNHGTHVAGTIGAIGDNASGVVGVNWDVQIMAVKFLNSQGSGSVSTAIAGLNYAVANGARISNNSWGDYNFSYALRDAISDADKFGHIVVAAAGNGNFRGIGVNNDAFPFYPASYDVDNVIAVAAIDHAGAKAGFSNYGAETVDLAAPGVSILSTLVGNTYGTFSGTSMATPHVAGITALVWGLHPEWTHHEVIAQVLGTTDPLASMDGITVSGGIVNAATAVGNSAIPGPEVLAFAGSRPIVSGETVFDFGVTPPGSPLERIIGIRNVGSADLLLGPLSSLPSGFSLVSGLSTSTLAPGEDTSFTVRLDAIAKGVYRGPVSFTTNDSDEGLIEFDIFGEVDFLPLYVDNGEPSFSVTGNWNLWTNQGYRGDVHEAFAGDGSEVASWTFENMAPGLYEVAATWTTNLNRASNSPYRIYDGGTLTSIARVNQKDAPDDFVDDQVSWERLGGLVAFTGDSLRIELANDADGRLNADGIRIKRINDLPAGPEIQVIGPSGSLEDGVSNFSFGNTPVGTNLTQSFIVRNEGLQTLELDGPISLPAGFSLVSGFQQTTLAPGEATSFTVALDSTLPGNFGGGVSFESNDADENPFDFVVSGTVELEPIIIDNGAAGFSTVGEWTSWSGQGYLNDVHESLPGTGDDIASWTFNDLPSGLYQVSATWTREWNRATNARFAMFDGTEPVNQALVNQTIAPNGFLENGVYWNHLAQPLPVTTGSLVIQLDDAADGRLNADGILIERVGDLSVDPDLVVSSEGQAIASGGLVDYGVTSPGTSISRTFNLRNTGTAPLVLDESITVPAGFTLTAAPIETVLFTGESTTLTITLDAVSDGSFAGLVAIASNDPNQEILEFTISGLVEDQPVVIDNSDPGFSSVGEWTLWTNQGLHGNVHESLPGVGNDVATWTFNGLSAGQYTVAATWTHNQNRASDALFTVLNGTNLVSAVELDQRVAPSEFNAGGVFWNTIDVVNVTGDMLIVELSDDADGRLNADGIRILRLGDLQSGPVAEVLSEAGAVLAGETVEVGSTLLGQPLQHEFTIRNVGTTAFEITSQPTIPLGYTLVSSYLPAVLDPGEGLHFVLELEATAEDLYEGLVSISTTDPAVGNIEFGITGLVAPPPRIIDNGNVGFSSVGEWTLWGGQGYGNDVHESFPGTGADIATWTFDSLIPARYRVASTWTSWINRATNATYSVHDELLALGTATVNQQLLPNEFFDQGVWWKVLGEFEVTSGALIVNLNDAANGRLNADAIRVEFVSPLLASSSVAFLEQTHDTGLANFWIALRDAPLSSGFRPITKAFGTANLPNALENEVSPHEAAIGQSNDFLERDDLLSLAEPAEEVAPRERAFSSFAEFWLDWGILPDRGQL